MDGKFAVFLPKPPYNSETVRDRSMDTTDH